MITSRRLFWYFLSLSLSLSYKKRKNRKDWRETKELSLPLIGFVFLLVFLFTEVLLSLSSSFFLPLCLSFSLVLKCSIIDDGHYVLSVRREQVDEFFSFFSFSSSNPEGRERERKTKRERGRIPSCFCFHLSINLDNLYPFPSLLMYPLYSICFSLSLLLWITTLFVKWRERKKEWEKERTNKREREKKKRGKINEYPFELFIDHTW